MFLGFNNILTGLSKKKVKKQRAHFRKKIIATTSYYKRDEKKSIEQKNELSYKIKNKDNSTSYRIPAFLILGVMKSGSTLLTSILQNHPLIPNKGKEEHFFDLKQDRESYEAYLDTFKLSDSKGISNEVLFDSTPSYFTLTYIIPMVYKVCPWVKFIVILRNPVDRLFSQYIHLHKREEYKDLSFEEMIQPEIDELQQLNMLNSPRNETAYKIFISRRNLKGFRAKAQHLKILVSRGLYSVQFRQWFRYFPRSSFKVFNFDDMTTNEKKGYAKVYKESIDFLGLAYEETVNFSRLYKNVGKYEGLEMKEETKKRLYELYKPFNEDLSNILGDEWKDIWEYKDII